MGLGGAGKKTSANFMSVQRHTELLQDAFPGMTVVIQDDQQLVELEMRRDNQ